MTYARVTARTDWNTGVMNSTWVNCKAIIQSDNPNEDKRVMMCVFPIGDVVIEDIWHTAGARGTGSNILVANDVFVPEYRVQPSEEFLGAKAPSIHDGEPWAAYPFVPVATMIPSALRRPPPLRGVCLTMFCLDTTPMKRIFKR